MALSDWKHIKKIGKGGQGETSLVSHIETGQYGVLKQIHSRNNKQRRRLLTEVTNLRVVRSKSGEVPDILDENTSEFETGNELFFVMSHIEGPTLDEYIKKYSVLSLEDATKVVERLANTLSLAHEEGISHRDIKPKNIIVRNENLNDVILLDFGLSFTETDTEKTETGEQIGNRFMALPEGQAYGLNRDPRSDVTQLVGIFLYLINGGSEPRVLLDERERPPHRREATAPKLKNGDPREQALEALFTRGFAVRLDERFQSVGEFITRLKQVDNSPSNEEVQDIETAAREANKRILDSNAEIKKSISMKGLAQKIQPIRDDIYNKYNKMRKGLEGFTLGIDRVTVNANQTEAGHQTNEALTIESLRFRITHNHTNTHYNITYKFVLSSGVEIGFMKTSSLSNGENNSSTTFLWMTEENQDIFKPWCEDIDREIVKGINRIADSLKS